MRELLAADEPEVVLRRVEFVGPQVGEDLTEQGGLAMICYYDDICLRYVSLSVKFAAGAVAHCCMM